MRRIAKLFVEQRSCLLRRSRTRFGMKLTTSWLNSKPWVLLTDVFAG
jgi:hypothetical protein